VTPFLNIEKVFTTIKVATSEQHFVPLDVDGHLQPIALTIVKLEDLMFHLEK
jgi:hypothetical protein